MSKKKNISLAVTFIFLGIFIWYGYNNPQIFKSLVEVPIYVVLIVAALKIFLLFLNGVLMSWLVLVFDKKVGVKESFYVGVLSAIGNFFGPLLGGAGIRAVYFKKYYKLPYSKFTSTLLTYYVITFILSSIFGIVAVLNLQNTSQTTPLLIFFIVCLIVLIALLFVRLPKKDKLQFLSKRKITNSIYKTIYNIESGWRLILSKKKLLTHIILLAVISYFTTYVVASIEFKVVGITATIPSLLLYTTTLTTALLLSITPGAIGIRETMLLVVGMTIGITSVEILQVSVLDRAIHFSLLFVLFVLTRNSKLKKSLTEKDNVI